MRGCQRLCAKAIAPAQVGLVRERLFTVAESRLASALAPAGYGKTRLLAQAADVFDGRSAGTALIRRPGTHAADGQAGRRAAPVLRRSGPGLLLGAGPRHRRAAGQAVLLVVDDFHELEGSASEQCLASLIESAPGCVRIVIAGRRWPRWTSGSCGCPVSRR